MCWELPKGAGVVEGDEIAEDPEESDDEGEGVGLGVGMGGFGVGIGVGDELGNQVSK